MENERFGEVFARLKAVMQAHAGEMRVEQDQPGIYLLIGPYMPRYKKELWFGKVEAGKSYVSYHLMPVYMFPDLLDGVSAALRKRMQGKSCFNFTAVNETLFAELAELTRLGVERCRDSGIFA